MFPVVCHILELFDPNAQSGHPFRHNWPRLQVVHRRRQAAAEKSKVGAGGAGWNARGYFLSDIEDIHI